jgi:hypothetical protein
LPNTNGEKVKQHRLLPELKLSPYVLHKHL